jgi:hypothetical protein
VRKGKPIPGKNIMTHPRAWVFEAQELEHLDIDGYRTEFWVQVYELDLAAACRGRSPELQLVAIVAKSRGTVKGSWFCEVPGEVFNQILLYIDGLSITNSNPSRTEVPPHFIEDFSGILTESHGDFSEPKTVRIGVITPCQFSHVSIGPFPNVTNTSNSNIFLRPLLKISIMIQIVIMKIVLAFLYGLKKWQLTMETVVES